MSLSDDRIAKGQCPRCGKEAAPYYLCYECRSRLRFARNINRGAKVGALVKEKRIEGTYFSLPKNPPLKTARWGSTPIHLPESDRRGHPRLRGTRVDVEATIIEVIRNIGRPCSIKEIESAWGRLRAKRSDPLPYDLSRIIVAADKRVRKMAKRAAIEARRSTAC
jgi:hypothetical protein